MTVRDTPLVLFRIVDPPETGFEATTGAYVALAAALVAWSPWSLVRRGGTDAA